MKSFVIIVISICVVLGIAFMVGTRLGDSNNPDNPTSTGNNVSIVDGKQIIEISAKGGYAPRNTAAKAGIPTIIKVKTRGTFDCSSALVIPSIGYRGNLPPSGETIIDVPPQKAGSVLRGLCAMGMYNFSVEFN